MVSSRIRLAVVDDHRMLLTALSHWIQEAATDLDLVASVPSWPDLLAHPAFPVDVVLLDLDLRDDLPISVKLRALDTVGVRTVLMSTYSDPGVVAEALAAGALGYIVKSESTDTIVLAIRAAVEGTPFVSPGLAPQLQADIGAPRLTAQERRVMALYSTGESAKRMATVLQISEQTAKSHLKRIRAKFKAAGVDVGTKLTLREQAIRTGLILLEDDGPSSSESSGTSTGRSDAGRSDAGRSDPGRSDPGRSDPGPSDPGPSDAGPSDAGPSDAGRSDARASESPRPDTL